MLKDFVAFDLEMPSQKEPSISAIGITVVENLKIKKRIYSLINPEAEFSKYVIELTGITPEMVLDKPKLNEYWQEIKGYFDGSHVLVAHGTKGDLFTFVLALQRYDIEWDDEIPFLCTCEISLGENPEYEKHSLDYLCEIIGADLSHHNAQSDSDGCAEVLIDFIKNGVDTDKYLKKTKPSQIIKQRNIRALERDLKSCAYRAKKAPKYKEEDLEFEGNFYKYFEAETDFKLKKAIESDMFRKSVCVFGSSDEAIKNTVKSISPDETDMICDSDIFYCYEMYRLYFRLFNRYGDYNGNFLDIITTLPLYDALTELELANVYESIADLELTVPELVEILIKRNVYGCTCLAIYIIKKEELYSKCPLDTLTFLKRMCVNVFSGDKVITKHFSDILSNIIVDGKYDKRIVNSEYSASGIKAAVKIALRKKPSERERIEKAYKKFLK